MRLVVAFVLLPALALGSEDSIATTGEGCVVGSKGCGGGADIVSKQGRNSEDQVRATQLLQKANRVSASLEKEEEEEEGETRSEQAKVANVVMQGWNSHEHQNLGDVAFQIFFDQAKGKEAWDDNVSALLDTFNNKDDNAQYLDNADPLHFGDFISLSGDYYSDMHRTDANGDVMYKEPGVQANIEKWTLGAIDADNSWGGATMYYDIDDGAEQDVIPNDFVTLQGALKYFRQLGTQQASHESLVRLTLMYPKMLELAEVNYNHFGKTAQLEYRKAHREAREYAFQAGQLMKSGDDPECALNWNGKCTTGICYGWRKSAGCEWEGWSRVCRCGRKYGKRMCSHGGVQCRPSLQAWTGRLQRAIELLGVGLHYYTDLFSAGHIRVPYTGGDDPNNTLYGKCGGSKNVALMVKCMHGEDNHVGVHVRNALGEEWTMYGDGMWFEREDGSNPNKGNRDVAIRGTVKALEDVWAAFQDGVAGREQSESSVGAGGAKDPLAYLGVATEKAFPPTLKVENGTILFRETPWHAETPRYVDFECPGSGLFLSVDQCNGMISVTNAGSRNDM